MDPFTQGVFGSLWAQSAARARDLPGAAAAGFLAGLAADLDVLIRSPTDPLLAVEYHRHFTHALVFVPAGALAVSLILWPIFKRRLPFGLLYAFCLLGFLSHGLLDAATSYGTRLFWPFSEVRIAWNFISVVDPLFTLPITVLLGVALFKRARRPVMLAVAWAAVYLILGGVQQDRAERILDAWAADQGLVVERRLAKPAFGNLVLWRGLVDNGQGFYVIAIRNVPFTYPLVYPGVYVHRFRAQDFPPHSRLGRDLARFDHFSSGWLFRYPPYEDGDTWWVGDFRYAIDPAGWRPLWGLRFDPADLDARARFERPSRVTKAERERFFARLLGRIPD